MTGGRRAALAATVLLAGAAGVLAHSFDPALLDLREREPGRFDVVWNSPAAARPGLGPTPAPVLPGHCRQIGDVTPPSDDPGLLELGLLHGLGFASALGELRLPHDHPPAALASFNLGVEAGQLSVVALVLLPVRWLQRQPRWVQAVPAYAIAAVAMAWTIEHVGACL